MTPTETLNPSFEWMSVSGVEIEKGSGWETPAWSDWHYIGGSVSEIPDEIYGTAFKYQIRSNPTQLVRIQLDKYGSNNPFEILRIRLPIYLGSTYIPDEDGGWASLVSIFNESSPLNLLATVDIGSSLRPYINAKIGSTGETYRVYKPDFRVNTGKWYLISLESRKKKAGPLSFSLAVDGKTVVTGTGDPENTVNSIVSTHGGAYGERLPGNSYILNGPMLIEAWS